MILKVHEGKMSEPLSSERFNKFKFLSQKYTTPVTISILIGVFYFSGWWYTNMYFSYFGLEINHDIASFSASYYLEKAFIPVCLAVYIFIFSISEPIGSTVSRLTAARHNLTILIFVVSFFLIGYIEGFSSILHYILFGFWIIALIFYIFASLKRFSIINSYLKSSASEQLFSIFFIILIIVLLGGNIAKLEAIQTIEGDKVITFNWNGDSPKEVAGKELVPIIHRNGNYYVAERQMASPKNPVVYIIPENKIGFVSIKKINNDKIPEHQPDTPEFDSGGL